MSFYKNALTFDVFLACSWYGISDCYFEMNRELDELSYVRKAIKLDEFNPEYFYLLGEVQVELGFFTEAIEAFEVVFDLEPENDTVLIDLANTSKKLNNLEDAMNYYVLGVQNQTKNGKLLYNFVGFLLQKGDIINAMFYLDVALKNHYKEKDSLFEAYEDAKYHPQVIDLLEYYKK